MIKWPRGPIYKKLRNVWLSGNYPKKRCGGSGIKFEFQTKLGKKTSFQASTFGNALKRGQNLPLIWPWPLLGWYSHSRVVTSANKHRRKHYQSRQPTYEGWRMLKRKPSWESWRTSLGYVGPVLPSLLSTYSHPIANLCFMGGTI